MDGGWIDGRMFFIQAKQIFVDFTLLYDDIKIELEMALRLRCLSA